MAALSSRAAAMLALLVRLVPGSAGCAGVGDSMRPRSPIPPNTISTIASSWRRSARASPAAPPMLQGLMAKAETGVGGSVVAELAYRNDYIAVRGQQKLADEAWQQNRCQESKPEANPAPTPPAIAPAPQAKGGRSPSRAGAAK